MRALASATKQMARTDLARALELRRKELGRTYRELAEKSSGLSHQALWNYEKGIRFPPAAVLEGLASAYEWKLPELRKAWKASLPQATAGPLTAESFLAALDTVGQGDHLVTITQHSIFAEQPDLLTDLIGILKKGAQFTYVSYLPTSETFSGDLAIWDNNHLSSAPLIHRKVRQKAPRAKLTNNVRYLLIGTPDAVDFFFVRSRGAVNYLCRAEARTSDTLDGWHNVYIGSKDHYWQPLTTSYLEDVHSWIHDYCGLAIPSASFDVRKATRGRQRNLRYVSLDDLVWEKEQRSK